MRLLKEHAHTLLFNTALLSVNAYILLRTLVIPSTVTKVTAETNSTTALTEISEATATDTLYQDDSVSITATAGGTSNTAYYVADTTPSSADYLKAALAQNTFGANITEATSSIVLSKNAISTINSDYYGANIPGCVIRDGTIYRSTSRQSDYDDSAIYLDGSFGTFDENDATVQELLDSSAISTSVFGPAPVSNGQVVVSESEEVG